MNQNYQFYWANDKPENQIPEVCRNTCEALWEAATLTERPEIDMFHDCYSSNLAHEDMSLQSGPGQKRHIGMLTSCETHGEDAFAEEYSFICPNS